MTSDRNVTVYPNDSSAQPLPLTVESVVKAYEFPTAPDLSSFKVGIIELGGGLSQPQLAAWCLKNNLPIPAFHTVGVDGAVDVPFGDPSGADAEVCLDSLVLAAAAPGCEQWLIFGENTNQGFIDAIQKAIDLQVDALSISWGAAECNWDADSIAGMGKEFAACNATLMGVYAAAGDNGSTDGETDGQNHVDYPGSDPNVLSVGGTRLILNPDGTRNYEKAWSLADGNGSTGGGLSDVFLLRSVPDLAANADPMSGYEVDVDGVPQVIGGTSGAAPLMAGLHIRIRAILGKRISTSQIKAALAALQPGDYFDVVDGSNGAFSAQPGPDLVSGIGVPDGTKLLAVLQSQLAPVVPAPTPAPTPAG